MDSRYAEFEDILTEVGGFGRYQRSLYLFLIPVSIISAFQSNTVHFKLVPDHWCSVKELSNFSHGEQHRFVRPIVKPSNCTKDVVRDSCLMFDIDYNKVLIDLRLPLLNESSHHKKLAVKPCDNGWVYDRSHYWDSFAMHFDFVCEHINESDIITTVRTAAAIFGTPFFGLMADLYGRRLGYLYVLITSIVSAMSPILCKEYTIFLVCQFIIGLTYPSSHIIILILEFMCPKDRAKTLSCVWLSFELGTIIHTTIIYFIPHWIWISVLNTASVLPIIFILRLIPESLQWLLSKAKYDLVEKSFKNIMQTNNKSIPEDLLSIQKIGKISRNESEETEVKQVIDSEDDEENDKNNEEEEEDNKNVKEKSKRSKRVQNIVLKFLRETTLFQILLILSICFAVNLITKQIFESNIEVVYENELLFDKIFWTSIKIPAILIAWFLMQRRIGRRLTNAVLLAIIGFTLIGLMFAESQQIKYLLSTFGISVNTASVMITYLQVIEVSPTTFRCAALTTSISLATLIVAIKNFVHTVDNYDNQWVYLVVVSTITLLTSFLLTFVAETLRKNMPQNIVSAEELLNDMKYWRLGKRKCDMKSNIFKSLSKWELSDGLDNT